MKKLLTIFVAAALMITALAGCQKAPPQKQEESKKPESDELKVALIVTDSVNDGGWNAAAYEGLQKIESELNAKVSYSEKVAVVDAEPALRDYATQGYDLVLCHSLEYGDAVMNVAPDFPNTKFVVYTGSVEADNVASISLNEYETGYLVGMVAASVSESGKIGVILGGDYPSMIRISEAYKLGAKVINPDITVYDVAIGTWSDMEKGKEAALSQIENGADVLYHVADGAGLGMIAAAKEKGVYAIGSSSDQTGAAPGTVITNSLDFAPNAYLSVAKSVQDNSFKGGIIKLGLADNAIDVNPFADVVPADIVKQVKESRQQIIDGNLVVPEIFERTNG